MSPCHLCQDRKVQHNDYSQWPAGTKALRLHEMKWLLGSWNSTSNWEARKLGQLGPFFQSMIMSERSLSLTCCAIVSNLGPHVLKDGPTPKYLQHQMLTDNPTAGNHQLGLSSALLRLFYTVLYKPDSHKTYGRATSSQFTLTWHSQSLGWFLI